MSLLHHGGRLNAAIKQYGIDARQWLDLSTGLSPWSYPVPHVPPSAWHRLPEEDDGLLDAAAIYYGNTNLIAVAGSQAAIQAIPALYLTRRGSACGVVGLPLVGYKEHEKAWRKAGFTIAHYQGAPTTEQLLGWCAVVIINPNNPSGDLIDSAQLQTWLNHCPHTLFVIDEAFADVDNSHSLSHAPCRDNLLILRSVGKFFGLAGIRAGFVLATPSWLDAFVDLLGPWTLTGPSRWACTQALSDYHWHAAQQVRLKAASARLRSLLSLYAPSAEAIKGTDLFQTVKWDNAPQWHDALCRLGIFTRLTDERNAIRFGLPQTEDDWQRLASSLLSVSEALSPQHCSRQEAWLWRC